jgi:hypothetical protein
LLIVKWFDWNGFIEYMKILDGIIHSKILDPSVLVRDTNNAFYDDVTVKTSTEVLFSTNFKWTSTDTLERKPLAVTLWLVVDYCLGVFWCWLSPCPTVHSYGHPKHYFTLFCTVDCIVSRVELEYGYENG